MYTWNNLQAAVCVSMRHPSMGGDETAHLVESTTSDECINLRAVCTLSCFENRAKRDERLSECEVFGARGEGAGSCAACKAGLWATALEVLYHFSIHSTTSPFSLCPDFHAPNLL